MRTLAFNSPSTTTTTVYRVARISPDGRGPYRAGSGFSANLCRMHSHRARCPSPAFDGMDVISGFFGFLDKESFCKWFSSDERQALFAHGYGLFEVETRQIYSIGDSGQLCFSDIVGFRLVAGSDTGENTCDGCCVVCGISDSDDPEDDC